MSSSSFSEIIDSICERDDRYRKGVYFFMRSALDHTLKNLKKKQELSESNHVSGQQLLEGIRSYALEQFGPLAYTVITYWGIQSSSDFGNIVFNLIEVGVLGKNENDDIADFEGGFDLQEALLDPFKPTGKSY